MQTLRFAVRQAQTKTLGTQKEKESKILRGTIEGNFGRWKVRALKTGPKHILDILI